MSKVEWFGKMVDGGFEIHFSNGYASLKDNSHGKMFSSEADMLEYMAVGMDDVVPCDCEECQYCYNLIENEEDQKMSNIRIALTNLGQYNEGRLNYVWLDLPASEDEIKKAMKEIGIGSKRWDGGVYEEYFITDYEAPFEIGEYSDLATLNTIAEELGALDDNQLIAFKAWIDRMNDNPDDALEVAISGDYSIHYDVDDMADIAREFVDQGLFEIDRDSALARYIDYESLGRDLSFDNIFVFIGSNCVEFYH